LPHVPAFSRRAIDALQPSLGDAIEAVRLDRGTPEFYAINVFFDGLHGGSHFHVEPWVLHGSLPRGRAEESLRREGIVFDVAPYAYEPDTVALRTQGGVTLLFHGEPTAAPRAL
jgi:hypothetical protein